MTFEPLSAQTERPLPIANLVSGDTVPVNYLSRVPASGAVALTLIAAPAKGNVCMFQPQSGQGDNAIAISGNGKTIDGLDAISVALRDLPGLVLTLSYDGTEWKTLDTKWQTDENVPFTLRDGGAPVDGYAAMGNPLWVVNPLTGDDSNPGTAALPLRTPGAVIERWGTNAPTLRQPTVVLFQEDVQNFDDPPFDVEPAKGFYNLNVVGLRKNIISDVLSAYTNLVRTPPAPANNIIAGTAILNFDPYLGLKGRATLQTRSTRGFGAGAPAVTLTGVPAVACEPIIVWITFAGALGVARFAWFLNGVLQATNVLTAAAVPLGATGVTANFPAGAYTTAQWWRMYSHAYFDILNANGNMNPGVSPAGATPPISFPMGLDDQYNPNSGVLMYDSMSTVVYGGPAVPAMTFTGVPQAAYHYLRVEIDGAGGVGVATFKWSIDGVEQATGVLTAASVVLGTTGVVINFPAGAYLVGNVAAGTALDYGISIDTPGAEKQQLTVGDAFTIQQPVKIWAPFVAEPDTGSGSRQGLQPTFVRFQSVWGVIPRTPPMGNLAPQITRYGNTTWSHCRWDAQIWKRTSNFFSNSRQTFHSGGYFAGHHWFYGGAIGTHGNSITTFTAGVFFGITFDADVIVYFSAGIYYQHQIGSAHLRSTFATVIRGPAGHLIATPNGRGIQYSAAAPLGATAIWGTSPINCRVGGALRVINTAGVTATSALQMAATPPLTLDGVSAGAAGPANPLSTYDPATGLWTGGAVTTPLAALVAALDAGAPLSGDMFSIQNPHTLSRVVMNGATQFN